MLLVLCEAPLTLKVSAQASWAPVPTRARPCFIESFADTSGYFGSVELVEIAGGWQILTRAEYTEAIERARKAVEDLAAAPTPAYGISTGFGALATRHIPTERRAQLQRSLVRSHAAGSGPEVDVAGALVFMGFAASWVFLYPLSFHAAGQWTDTTAAIFHGSVLLVGLSIVTWCLAILHTVVGPALQVGQGIANLRKVAFEPALHALQVRDRVHRA